MRDAHRKVVFFGNGIPTDDKMIGWKSNANFFPCVERLGEVIAIDQDDLQCGTGKKEDIPARLTQLTAGGLDAGLGEEKLIASLNAAIEYVASIMMKKSTKPNREPSTYRGITKLFSANVGVKGAMANSERWKGIVDCDGGFWEKLGRDDYESPHVTWGVADETVFSNTAAPGNDQIIIPNAPDDELMYGGTICGTTARETNCFQVRACTGMRWQAGR